MTMLKLASIGYSVRPSGLLLLASRALKMYFNCIGLSFVMDIIVFD